MEVLLNLSRTPVTALGQMTWLKKQPFPIER